MDDDHAIRRGRLSYLESQGPLPAAADLALRAAVIVTRWTQRARTRSALKRLERHRLKDIGKTPHEAWREAARPFWCD